MLGLVSFWAIGVAVTMYVYMSAFAQKWANWGTPNGVATSIIPSDFQGMGRACSDLGVTALVCREKVEKLCVSWWGSHF